MEVCGVGRRIKLLDNKEIIQEALNSWADRDPGVAQAI